MRIFQFHKLDWDDGVKWQFSISKTMWGPPSRSRFQAFWRWIQLMFGKRSLKS